MSVVKPLYLLRLGSSRPIHHRLVCRSLSTSIPLKTQERQTSHTGWEGSDKDNHVVNRQQKGDKQDVQGAASAAGIESRKQDTGGQATRQKDEGDHNKRAKKDHPEAPEPVIGMNDERGGKGH